MPVITTIGAMSARGFGFSSGGGASFWWADFSDPPVLAGERIYTSLTSDQHIIVGTNASPAVDAVYLAKLSSSGRIIDWQDTYTADTIRSNKIGGPVLVNSSDAMFVAGQFRDHILGAGYGVMEIASSGATVTAQYIGDDSAGSVSPCVADGAGNIYFISPAGLFKLNSSLAFQWGRTLSGAGLLLLGLATDGTSFYTLGSDSLPRWSLTKWNSSGNITWSKFLTSTITSNEGNTVCVAPSGNVYGAGTVHASADSYVSCVNSSGAGQWQRALTAGGAWFVSAVDSAGNLYVGGNCSAGGALAKYDTNGALLWQRSIGTSAGDTVYGLVIDDVNSAMVIGLAGASNQIVVRLPTDGTHTGTFGALTYAVSSFAASTPTETIANTGFTASAHTPTTVALTLSVAPSTATATVTGM